MSATPAPVRDLAGRTITVVGAGRSGLAVARFLLMRRAQVTVTEQADTPQLRRTLAQLQDDVPGGLLTLELGGHTTASLRGAELVITSPVITLQAPPLQWAREGGIPVVSELEFASWFCPCPIIAVTGTNGKSTLATVIGELLAAAGRSAVVCGNIGFPLTAALRSLREDSLAVVEVSSFQLEHCHTLQPHVAVLLNITPNHLDHHASLDEYVMMKHRLVARQTPADWVMLNADDPLVARAAQHTRAQVIWWGRAIAARNGLTGVGLAWHPAYRVGELFGVPSSVMHHVFRQFRGLPHRQEVVGTRADGVRFVNDSKSTTPASLQWALESVEGPLVLVAGGRNKGLDFTPVVSTMARLNAQALSGPRIRQAVVVGEMQRELSRLFASVVPTVTAPSLPAAVQLAAAAAHPGDTVLFSPGCASFDMFRDFEDRGNQFTALVTRHQSPVTSYESAPRCIADCASRSR